MENRGEKRKARHLEDLTPEQRAIVEGRLARRNSPEGRAESARVEELVMEEVPPAVMPRELAESLAGLKRERERLGLTLADVHRRSGLAVTLLSRLENGKVINPTVATLHAYAAALGRRWAFATVPED